MRSTQPPCIAEWLLRHFGSRPNNAELLGDLDERYGHGHSCAWYWRQAVVAIVVSFFKEVWTHKPLAIRALVIVWAMKVAWVSGFLYVYGLSARRLFSAEIEASIFVALVGIIAMMSTGWIIAQTHRVHHRPMVLLYLLIELIASALTFLFRGLFGDYYWIFPLTQVLNAIFAHMEIFNFVAAFWMSAVITILSILVGGGFSRNDSGASSAEQSATA